MMRRLAFLIPMLLLQGIPTLAQPPAVTHVADDPNLTAASALVLARQVLHNTGNRDVATYVLTLGGISGILDRAGYGGTDSDCDLLAETLVQLRPDLRHSVPTAADQPPAPTPTAPTR